MAAAKILRTVKTSRRRRSGRLRTETADRRGRCTEQNVIVFWIDEHSGNRSLAKYIVAIRVKAKRPFQLGEPRGRFLNNVDADPKMAIPGKVTLSRSDNNFILILWVNGNT